MFVITSCQRSRGTDRKTDRREEEGGRKQEKQAKLMVTSGLNHPP